MNLLRALATVSSMTFLSRVLGYVRVFFIARMGADVIKYGEPIGRTTAAIAKGEHVHVHNVVSHRGRKEGA